MQPWVRQDEIERAFRDTFSILDRRMGLFLPLPLSTLLQLALQKAIDNIGHQ
jgi:arsenate reductase